MSASISDVAARAGVSVATVSRALRGMPSVREETRERGLAAARELGYVGHPHASRLAAGHNSTIGMVIPVSATWYFQLVMAGAGEVLAGADYDLVLFPVTSLEARDRFLTLLPFRKRVDGLILTDFPLSDPEQRALAGVGTPIVGIGIPSRHYPVVAIDNRAAGRLATRHLLGFGHSRIACITGFSAGTSRFEPPYHRRDGHREALAEVGLPCDGHFEESGGFLMSGGAAAMRRLLALPEPPTAIAAHSDEMAIGALQVLKQQGIGVPDDLSIIGFDGHEVTEYLGLTTVVQPMRVLGEVAADMLLAMIRSLPDGLPPPKSVSLPVELADRDSTGPAPDNGG